MRAGKDGGSDQEYVYDKPFFNEVLMKYKVNIKINDKKGSTSRQAAAQS